MRIRWFESSKTGLFWVPGDCLPEPKMNRPNQFDAKVAGDAKFAGNPRARLQWWYERSPYLEPDRGGYPVVRID